MTNREWLQQLSTEDFAEFFLSGLYAKRKADGYKVVASVGEVAKRYTHSVYGLIDWLNKPQEYEVVKDGEE